MSRRIAIMCGGDWKNNGNLIMTQNFISYMHNKVKGISFLVFESLIEEPARGTFDIVLKGLNADIDFQYCNVLSLPYTLSSSLIGKFKEVTHNLKLTKSRIVELTKDCDTIVYLGGDHFIGRHGSYMSGIEKWIFRCYDILSLKRAGKKVYIVSQSIGAFPWYLKPIIKIMFKNVDRIYPRDTSSENELRKLGITRNVTRTYDLGFLPLHNEISDKKGKSVRGDYVTFTVSDLYPVYANSIENHAYQLNNMIHTLHRITKLSVYVMVHSCNKDEQKLVTRLQGMTNNPCIHFLPPEHPLELRYILGKSKLNVSMRMHATISSLEQGVMSLPIANVSDLKGGPKGSRYSSLFYDLKLHVPIVNGLNHRKFKRSLKIMWLLNNRKACQLYIKKCTKQTIKKAMIPINDIARKMNKSV